MFWPKNFYYHDIKYDGQNLSMKYDRDHPPPPSAPSYMVDLARHNILPSMAHVMLQISLSAPWNYISVQVGSKNGQPLMVLAESLGNLETMNHE